MMLYCDVNEIQTIDGGVKEKVYTHTYILWGPTGSGVFIVRPRPHIR